VAQSPCAHYRGQHRNWVTVSIANRVAFGIFAATPQRQLMDETERRKLAIASGATDFARWSDPRQLDPLWEARAAAAADLIGAGTRVLDIGCGAMRLEHHLPFRCHYQPMDIVARDERTVIADLNVDPLPEELVEACDLVVMLGVWEYLYRPDEIFAAIAAAGKPILCSYCDMESATGVDRRALGWVNDLSVAQFLQIAARNGYRAHLVRRVDPLQQLYRFTLAPAPARHDAARIHIMSCNNLGNFGDRLGFHTLSDILPARADVSWGTLRPFSPVPEDVDLLIVGIGNSLFGDLLDDFLLEAVASARNSIGIFGTQYRPVLPVDRLHTLLDKLTWWYARYQEDVDLYARGRSNVSHLGDWLINAFPMTLAEDETLLTIGPEVMEERSLDRTIQTIQRHRKVMSTRLHPLLCALTSAEQVAYAEQRETGGELVSGKFRSMLLDVFGAEYPENEFWKVDREQVRQYKARVRDNTCELKLKLESLLP
jgi:hypothetical protein